MDTKGEGEDPELPRGEALQTSAVYCDIKEELLVSQRASDKRETKRVFAYEGTWVDKGQR